MEQEVYAIQAVVRSGDLKSYSLETRIAYALYYNNHYPQEIPVDGVVDVPGTRLDHTSRVFKAGGGVKYYKKALGKSVVVVHNSDELLHLCKVNRSILSNLSPELSALHTSYLKLLHDNKS